MKLSPNFFTNTESDGRDMEEVFMDEYNNRVDHWECEEDMDVLDFADMHFDEWKDWDWEDNSWERLRYCMWYCCGVFLGEYDDNPTSFCEWYNSVL